LELRGIFRYVNPYDSLSKVEEQLELARQGRERLLAGQPFDLVAQELSQAGSRSHGGLLPRRYLQGDNRIDQLLARLEPGQISPVISVDNGFWVYQLLAKERL
jgi:parvulin-like peptidyl-prolyl isomerase